MYDPANFDDQGNPIGNYKASLVLEQKPKENLPAQFKCSRCKGDMREFALLQHSCRCPRSHPANAPNRSGGRVYATDLEYHGI